MAEKDKTEMKQQASEEEFLQLYSRMTTKVAYHIQDKLPKFLTELDPGKAMSKQIMSFNQEQYEKGKTLKGMERGLELNDRQETPWKLYCHDLLSEDIVWVMYNKNPAHFSYLRFDVPGVYSLKFNSLDWQKHTKSGEERICDSDGKLLRAWKIHVGPCHLSEKCIEDKNLSLNHAIVLHVTPSEVRLTWATKVGEVEIPGAKEAHYACHMRDVFENRSWSIQGNSKSRTTLSLIATLTLMGHVTCEMSRLPDFSPIHMATFAKC